MATFTQAQKNIIAKMVDVITASSYNVVDGMGTLSSTALISGSTQGLAYTKLTDLLTAMSEDNKTDLIEAVEAYDCIKFDDVEISSVEGIGEVKYSTRAHKKQICDYVKNSLLPFFKWVDIEAKRAPSASMNIGMMR